MKEKGKGKEKEGLGLRPRMCVSVSVSTLYVDRLFTCECHRTVPAAGWHWQYSRSQQKVASVLDVLTGEGRPSGSSGFSPVRWHDTAP